MNSKIIREACIETIEEAVHAERQGADRLELCSALDKDGLTPSLQLTKGVLDSVSIPVKVMIRSREGDFEYTDDEVEFMLAQMHRLSQLAVSGFVFGATIDRQLDLKVISRIANHALLIPVTVHKAIDYTDDPIRAVTQLSDIHNVEAILTSGGAATALQGREIINSMHEAAEGKLQIIAAGKITNENLNAVRQHLKVQEYHGRRIVGTI